MGLLSSSTSLTRYQVIGKLEDPVIEAVGLGLKNHTIRQIDGDIEEQAVGWTSLDNPYKPDFEGSSYVIGTFFVFSLRIDKKNIPTRVFKKYYAQETEKILSESKRQYLSRSEKSELKDRIMDRLLKKMPANPNIYDLIWDYESSNVLFFSNLKSSNEEVETLFRKSFNLDLIRIFPYTAAELMAGLTNDQKDTMVKLSPSSFME